MAVDPNVRWAISLEVDGVSGEPNREPIPPEVRTSGLKRLQPETRQWFNQQLYNLGEGILQCERDYQAADLVEKNAREAADDNLQSQITQEVNDRQDGDQSIRDDLTPLTGSLAQAIMNQLNPVGTIHYTEGTYDPNVQFGFGTWELIEGRYLVGYSSTDSGFGTVGSVFGSKTHDHNATTSTTTNVTVNDHVLTEAELPATSPLSLRSATGSSGATDDATVHPLAGDSGNSGALSETNVDWSGAGEGHNHTASATSTSNTNIQDENHLPPSRVVYIWKRIA